MIAEIKKKYSTNTPPNLARILNTNARSFTAISSFISNVERFES